MERHRLVDAIRLTQRESAANSPETHPAPDRRSRTGAAEADDRPRTRVALVDPRPLMRASLFHLLMTCASTPDHPADFAITPLSSASELLDHSGNNYPDVSLVVLNVGGRCLSEEGVRENLLRLTTERPELPVIILGEEESPARVLDALQQGARGYISTTHDPTLVVQAIRLVQAGGTYVPGGVLRQILANDAAISPPTPKSGAPGPLGGLTPRQTEVLGLLHAGKSNKVIAYELNMQESTVKVHVREIMRRLNATNRTQAAFLLSTMRSDGSR